MDQYANIRLYINIAISYSAKDAGIKTYYRVDKKETS